jgi:hypothetical protein
MRPEATGRRPTDDVSVPTADRTAVPDVDRFVAHLSSG